MTTRKYRTLQNLICSSALLLATLPVSASNASDFSDLGKKIRVSGFGTLATTYTDSDRLRFRSNLTQTGETRWGWKSDSLIGVQFDAPLSEHLSATVQLIGRDRVGNDLNSSVEWAYITYQSSDDWVVRFGRVALDLALAGDFGSVGYAYDAVRVPSEFYSQVAIYSYDGMDVSYNYHTDGGVFSTKLFGGIARRDYQAQHSESNFKLSPIIGIGTRFESDTLVAKLGFSHSEFDDFSNSDVEYLKSLLQPYASSSSVADTLEKLDLDSYAVDFYSAGLVYWLNDWKVTGEISYLDSDAALFLSYFSAYAGVFRRIDDYSLFGMYSHGHSTSDVYQVPGSVPGSSSVQQLFDVVDSDQSTMSFGVRWDFATQMALKFQWDRSWVEANKALLWGRDSDYTAKQTVDVFTLSLNFIF